jgi:hypothetical protein
MPPACRAGPPQGVSPRVGVRAGTRNQPRGWPGRDRGRVDVSASAAVKAAREICRMALGPGPMKEMVQLPFMGGHARGLLDELRHLARLGDKSRM